MAKARKVWTYRPAKPRAPSVPTHVKADVQAQAQYLIEAVLGPRHIKLPPKDPRFNYLVAISTKWWRHYFYFTATYAVLGPNALVPSFEDPFARLEYAGGDRFHLAFRRHTGSGSPSTRMCRSRSASCPSPTIRGSFRRRGKRGMTMDFRPGDRVIWWKGLPGGDYVAPLSATVLAITAQRVRIEADDDGRMVIRAVMPERLQHLG